MVSPAISHLDPRPPPKDYEVGDLIVRVGLAQVTRDERQIQLPRLSFDLLLALVQAAPNVVTIDELIDRVWAGAVVSPETVSQRVKLLRAALDDPSRNPRYIAGVRGRGYRIIAPVREAARNLDGALPPGGAQRRHARTLSWVVVASFAFIALMLSLLMVPQRQLPDIPALSVAVLPFENLGHSMQDAALAFGVPETLLHRLASNKDLTVIARKSSFKFQNNDTDVREIGRQLRARYLVEGSLQSDDKSLRITAQLIDSRDGSHIWSMQFDRKPQDIFAIQDEIASKIAQALQVTVAGARGSETRNFDAYLAYAQGRTRMVTLRVADLKLAIDDFERAISFDPRFASAYASLARAHTTLAWHDITEERQASLEKATALARQLLDRALQLDSSNADARFEFSALLEDPSQAEAEIRLGLLSNPNSAIGHARLVDVLWQQGRRNEALAALERVRELDPLELENDNKMAAFVLYVRSDLQKAEELSLNVLQRDPSSSGALHTLGEIFWCCRSQYARGAKYIEQALQTDPGYEFSRRMLMRAYLDMGDEAEAEAVAASASNEVAARMVPVFLYRHDWVAAGEETYDEVRRSTGEPIDAGIRAFAARMHARETGDYKGAREYLEGQARVYWNSDGIPRLPRYEGFLAVELASLLMDIGETGRATLLLRASLSASDYEAHQLGRGEMWTIRSDAHALALLGRDAEALSTLERIIEIGFTHDSWQWLDLEPTYDRYRDLPRFKAVTEKAHKIVATQRADLAQMRRARQIPWRTRPKTGNESPPTPRA